MLFRSQVAAALMSFAATFLLLIVVNWLGFIFQGGVAGEIVRSISAFEHMEDFSRGLVDVRPLVLYISGTALVLFVTMRIVESRKWR